MLTLLDRLEFKGVFRLALKLAGGPEKAPYISGRVGRSESFREYGLPDRDDRQPAFDVVIEVDRANGDAALVGWMARRLGYVLVKAPDTAPAASDVGALLQCVETSARAIAADLEARKDGKITAEEKRDVLHHYDCAARALEASRLFWEAIEP